MNDLGPSMTQMLQVAAALAMVIGLVLLLGFLLRRGLRRPGTRHLRVEERLSLGRGIGLAVVLADGQRLLVGVTDKTISLVSRLDVDSGAEEEQAPELPPRGRSPLRPAIDFAKELASRIHAREAAE